MPIATGTALAIAGLASAATSLYSGKKASDASKDAAKLQTQAGDAARNKMDEVYGPYMAAGRNALSAANASNRLTAPPPGSRYASPDPTMGPQGGAPRAMPRPVTLGGLRQPSADMPQGASTQDPRQPPPRSMNVATFGQRPPMTLGAMREPGTDVPQGTSIQDPRQGPPRSMDVATFGRQGFVPPQMVTLQAPDGSVQQVPAHLAAQFEARGARRVQ